MTYIDRPEATADGPCECARSVAEVLATKLILYLTSKVAAARVRRTHINTRSDVIRTDRTLTLESERVARSQRETA